MADMSQEDRHTVLMTIGTCRIFHPMRIMASQQSWLKLDQTRTYGYTHAAGKAVQQARFITGEFSFPEQLWQFVSSEPYRLSPDLNDRKPDVQVGEISSFKEVKVDGVCIKNNCFDAVVFNREVSSIFWRDAAWDDLAGLHC